MITGTPMVIAAWHCHFPCQSSDGTCPVLASCHSRSIERKFDMKPYHPSRRMFTPVLACVLASAVALAAAMTVDPGPTQASPAHAGTPGIASNNALAQVPVSAAGFTCRGFPPECGYLFSKHATKVVMKAAAAGGVVAAATACNAIPGVSELVCSVIGAVSGVTRRSGERIHRGVRASSCIRPPRSSGTPWTWSVANVAIRRARSTDR